MVVVGHDQRGFGKTGRKNGPLGHSDGYDKVLGDIDIIGRRIRIEGVPHFVFGHSMGGGIALVYGHLHGKQENIRGVISSAPAIKADPSVEPHPILISVLSFVSHIVPTFKMSLNLPVDALCRDPAVIEEYKASQYNYDIGTLSTLRDMLQNAKKLLNDWAKVYTMPFLLAHGENDTTTSPQSSKEFFGKVPESTDKTLRIWNGLVHELHNEPEKWEVIQEYVDWITKRI